VAPKNQPIYSELATTIEIDDEAAGEYVRICQPYRNEEGTVWFCVEEWDIIKAEIDKMMSNCRDYKDEE
jgi:hypothetical protein